VVNQYNYFYFWRWKMDKGSVYGNLTNARKLNQVSGGGEQGSVYGSHTNARRLTSARSESSQGSVYGSLINAQRLVTINANAFTNNASLLGRIGGDAAIGPMLRYFYAKALRDKRIRNFFDYDDVRDMERRIQSQLSFLKSALGGLKNAEVANGTAHLAALGLSDAHFDAVIDNLVVTLREQNVPGQLIKEMVAFCDSMRKDVLG
jgi:hemoglobin